VTHELTERSTPAELYWSQVLREVPRTLGMMDREPLSPTAGCCDRTYWAWKFTDFPGARFQESVCVMAFLHQADRSDNPYYRNERLLAWLDLGLRFWTRIQHSDGSYDEAYPNERSLAATAFTAFYAAEALSLCGESLEPDAHAAVMESLTLAGKWLCRNDEEHGMLSNHLAAAAAALLHIHRLTGSSEFKRRSEFFTDRILKRQSSEGWFEEYGGADPGYQTHGSFYLARMWQLTGDEELLAALKRSVEFLSQCIHPDGSLGGEYASRNTQTYYPAAFEMLAPVDDGSRWIAQRMQSSVVDGAAAGLQGIDAWNYFPLLNNLVFAYHAACAGGDAPVVARNTEGAPALTWFPDAGIARIHAGGATIVIGTSKGGTVKAFAAGDGRLTFSDCGYIGRLGDQKVCSTQYLDRGRRTDVSDTRVVVRGVVVECARPVMSPARFVAFRSFMLTIGVMPSVAQWLKRQLVRVLISRRRELQISFQRTIEVQPGQLIIEDELAGPDLSRLTELWRGASFTTVHMGSSRYFIANEIRSAGSPTGLDPVPLDGNRSQIIVRRTHSLA
jgi:hypothetical protein